MKTKTVNFPVKPETVFGDMPNVLSRLRAGETISMRIIQSDNVMAATDSFDGRPMFGTLVITLDEETPTELEFSFTWHANLNDSITDAIQERFMQRIFMIK